MVLTLTLVDSVLAFFRESIFIFFGHVIPMLSSVKAVLHRDVDAYHQWVTYFVILYVYQTIVEPIFHLVLPSYVKLPLVMWLSLPRYQGALWVYSHIFQPQILDRYEKRVDKHISYVKRSTKQKMFDCFGYFRWNLFSQVGLILSAIRGENFMEEHSNSAAMTSTNDAHVSIVHKSHKRRPQHSITIHNSSFSTMNGFIHNATFKIPESERDEYLEEFLEMLRCGLYVFASYTKEKSSKQCHNEKHEQLGAMKRKNSVRLSILSYKEESDSISISNIGDEDSQTVPTLEKGHHFPLKSLCCVKKCGAQGVKIISIHDDFVFTTEIILSDSQDRDILLEGLRVCVMKKTNKSNPNSSLVQTKTPT